MGYIPEAFVTTLLNNIDIVAIINSYVPLKKVGHNFVALCPFHHENSPSFNVVNTKQFFHCFGCGAGGSVIKFVMDFEKIPFTDAVHKLAKIAGLTVPENDSNLGIEHAKEQEYFKVNSAIANWYSKNLIENVNAQNYLKDRGISIDTLTKFQLGYALDYLPNYSQELLEELGLGRKDYPKFRNRIMFPIHNSKGLIIGFGGRVIQNDIKPKYLNSPETKIFKKSHELYGLYQALSENKPKDYFVMVEGYMDVLALYQYGITNVVATLGTATSYQHINKLFKYTDTIIVCFDGDIAGKNAAVKAMQQALPILSPNKNVKFCFLPEGEDPDSLIIKHGKIGFLNFLNKALSLFDFVFNFYSSNLDLDNLIGKSKFLSLIKPIINKLFDPILKELFLHDLAKKLALPIASLMHMLEVENFDNNVNHNAPTFNNEPDSVKDFNNKLMNKALSILIQFPEFLVHVDDSNLSVINNNIFLQIVKLIRSGANSTAQILDKWPLQDDSKKMILKFAGALHLVPSDALEAEFKDILINLKERANDSILETLMLKVKKNGMQDLTSDEKKELIALLKRHEY